MKNIVRQMIYLDFAGALSLAAVRGGDGVVGAVGDGAAEVEAEPVLEGQLVRAAPGVHLWRRADCSSSLDLRIPFRVGLEVGHKGNKHIQLVYG